MNTDLLTQWFFVIVRYVSPYAAAYVAAKTGVTSDAAAAWLGTSLTIVMAIWAMANKAHYETKVNTALDAQAGTSKDTLKSIISSGNGASALEAK